MPGAGSLLVAGQGEMDAQLNAIRSPGHSMRSLVVIRHNRFRSDHGWDIDLDDGASNYRIYDNVCLAAAEASRGLRP